MPVSETHFVYQIQTAVLTACRSQLELQLIETLAVLTGVMALLLELEEYNPPKILHTQQGYSAVHPRRSDAIINK